MKPILLLLFAATAACVGALLPLISRARSKRLLLNAVRRASSDAPDGIGISVLCSGVTDAAQIENLLSPEYSRYEVIVVLDARRHAAEFAALTARYRMIRVEWVCSGELEVSGVRALGRSRRRCFRRLVLVDRAQDSEAGDFDAAASVATYDYLLPVRAGCFLLPGSVERLVAELGEGRPGSLDLIRSPLGEPAALLSREAVVAAGGFGMRPLRGGGPPPPRSRPSRWYGPAGSAPRGSRAERPFRPREASRHGDAFSDTIKALKIFRYHKFLLPLPWQ
ncbi:hypothetical protein [Alistipes sp.]|uniref:hypothetical protein n=1 Tax=Alistipes sp. TaxID=1872444 RepID=UPI003AB7D60E